MNIAYLCCCFILVFLPLETYLAGLLIDPFLAKPTQSAVLVWHPWLALCSGLFFFGKGLALYLAGSFFTDHPVLLFFGFLLALLSETCSPLKKNRHILVLGLGFLSGYQFWGWLIYSSFFLALLIFVHYRAPVLVAAAGLYALTFIPAGDPYQLAAALVLFILLCLAYLNQLRAYFDGQAPNILAELRPARH